VAYTPHYRSCMPRVVGGAMTHVPLCRRLMQVPHLRMTMTIMKVTPRWTALHGCTDEALLSCNAIAPRVEPCGRCTMMWSAARA
jgi:predicted  nucleic acid-binding Zn ribbon protein